MLILVLASCSITKRVPEDQYLLSSAKLKFEGATTGIDKDEVYAIIKQKPNRKVLWISKIYLRAYNLFSAGKTRKWKTWLIENISEPPVILDSSLTSRSTSQMSLYLIKNGFFDARVRDTTTYFRKKANVTFSITPGLPYRISSLTYSVEDSVLKKILDEDAIHAKLHANDIYHESSIEKESERIISLYRNRGYYFFDKTFIRCYADSSHRSKSVSLLLSLANPFRFDADSNLEVLRHRRFTIDTIRVFTDYNFMSRIQKPFSRFDTKQGIVFYFNPEKRFPRELLRRNIYIKPGSWFCQDDVQLTYNRISSLRIFNSIKIDFEVKDSSRQTLTGFVRLSQGKKQYYTLELTGTHSAGNYGILGNLTYQNRNLFKGAEIFQFKTGLEIKQVPVVFDSSYRRLLTLGAFNTFEFAPEISISIPQLYPYIKTGPGTIARSVISFSYNYQNNPNYFRTIFNGSWGYTLQRKFTRFEFYPLEISFLNVDLDPKFANQLELINNLQISQRYKPQLFNNLRTAFLLSNQNDERVKNAFYLYTNAEIGGVIPTLINRWQGTPLLQGSDTGYSTYYRFMGISFNNPYAQFFRLEADYRYYFRMDLDQSIVFRTYGGVGYAFGNSQSLPFVKSYFAGGPSDIRAWRPRTLGPGVSFGQLVERIGDLKFTFNLEYRVKAYKYLNIALFTDAGNIWLLNTDNFTNRPGAQFKPGNFFSQLAWGAGIGLRLDFSFFIIRLDPAFPIYDPGRAVDQRWVIKNLKSADINLFNLGIGYPF